MKMFSRLITLSVILMTYSLLGKRVEGTPNSGGAEVQPPSKAEQSEKSPPMIQQIESNSPEKREGERSKDAFSTKPEMSPEEWIKELNSLKEANTSKMEGIKTDRLASLEEKVDQALKLQEKVEYV